MILNIILLCVCVIALGFGAGYAIRMNEKNDRK
jgi:hypothetical protein